MNRSLMKRGFFGAILFFFLISLLLNVLLYSQLRKYYTMLYADKLDPLGLLYFETGSARPKPDPELKTVVFFGDSRAAQWPAPDVEGFWFVNRGIGNQTSAQIASRFDAHIRTLEPDLLVLQMCINDIKTIPLFPEQKQRIVTDCEARIDEIIHEALDMQSLVVVSTIFPTGRVPLERRLVWSEAIDESVVEVNDYIRTLSSEKVIVFDAFQIVSDENGQMKQEYSFDELHLNEAGYQAINIEFGALLEELKQDLP